MGYQPVSIMGDSDNHSNAHEILSNTAEKTYFSGVLIGLEESDDGVCLASENQRCYIEGRKVHRVGDSRECGGVTVGPEDRNLLING